MISVTPSRTSSNFWEGFAGRFQNLWEVTKDRYILMPTLTLGIITAAIVCPPIGLALTAGAVALIGYKAHQASSNYFLDNPTEGVTQFGETLADITLLGGGLALGRVGQALLPIQKGTNAGAALHLVDEVAAGILVVKKTLQNE